MTLLFTKRHRQIEAAHREFIHSGGLSKPMLPERWNQVFDAVEKVK